METETDFEYQGHLFMLPLYTYLIEPGPRPGFIQRADTSEVFLPLWTDRDLVQAYLRRIGTPQQVAMLEMHTRQELALYLRTAPPDVKYAAVDSDGTAKCQMTMVMIAPLLSFPLASA